MPRWAVVALVAAVVLGSVSLGLSGCQLGDVVQTRIPPQMRDGWSGGEDRVSLNEAMEIREHYVAESIRAVESLDRNIESSQRLLGILSSLANEGLAEAVPFLSAIPGGALGVSALTMLAGWLLPDPRARKREDAAYDTALADVRKNGLAPIAPAGDGA